MMLSTAIESSPAVRATALLIPEAIPAWRTFTAPITVVVSGATVIAMPRPNTNTAGKRLSSNYRQSLGQQIIQTRSRQ